MRPSLASKLAMSTRKARLQNPTSRETCSPRLKNFWGMLTLKRGRNPGMQARQRKDGSAEAEHWQDWCMSLTGRQLLSVPSSDGHKASKLSFAQCLHPASPCG